MKLADVSFGLSTCALGCVVGLIAGDAVRKPSVAPAAVTCPPSPYLAYLDGREARRAGAPATANPYRGTGSADGDACRQWLRGWCERNLADRPDAAQVAAE